MKIKILFFLIAFFATSNIKNAVAQDSESGGSPCPTSVAQSMSSVKDELIKSDKDDINNTIRKQPSVVPTEEEDPCFDMEAPNLAITNLQIKENFEDLMSPIADMLFGFLDFDISEMLSDLFTVPDLGSLINEACLMFIDEMSDSSNSVLSFDKSKYNTDFDVPDYNQITNTSSSISNLSSINILSN
jgi:hypothetical protein